MQWRLVVQRLRSVASSNCLAILGCRELGLSLVHSRPSKSPFPDLNSFKYDLWYRSSFLYTNRISVKLVRATPHSLLLGLSKSPLGVLQPTVCWYNTICANLTILRLCKIVLLISISLDGLVVWSLSRSPVGTVVVAVPDLHYDECTKVHNSRLSVTNLFLSSNGLCHSPYHEIHFCGR